jgi:hypothetical protein
MIPSDHTQFVQTLNEAQPPENWPLGLQALWWEAKDDWEAAHDIAQELHTPLGSWIHAHLHRKEGDRFNAGYWYRQAGRPYPNISLAEELKEMVVSTLKERR